MNLLLILFFVVLPHLCISRSHEKDIKLKEIAIKAAKSQGCLGEYGGELDTSVTTRSPGFTEGLVKDVLIVRACESETCSNMRIAPFAKVTFNCDLKPIVSGMNCRKNGIGNEA